jgi:hypothetical protein|tara:strand:- start:24240 stop:26060 length:1821 start_codon:yes stop_codon:yes gene_type:complete
MPESLDVSGLIPLRTSIYWHQAVSATTSTINNVADAHSLAIFGYTFDDLMARAAANGHMKLRVRFANWYPKGDASRSLAQLQSDYGDVFELAADDEIGILPDVPIPYSFLTKTPDTKLDGRIGNLGVPRTNQREKWWDLLLRANGPQILDNPKIDSLTQDQWGSTIYGPRTDFREDLPDLFDEADYAPAGSTLYDKQTPDLFMLGGGLVASSFYGEPYSIVTRVVSLHNKLFGSGLKPTDAGRLVLRIDSNAFKAIMDNVQGGLNALEILTDLANPEVDETQEEIDALLDEGELAEGFQFGGFDLEPLSAYERRAVMSRDEYQKYFSTTFSKETIVTIPIIQNFYLTTKYFQNVSDAFQNTNSVILDILLSTIRNDDDYKKKPQIRRTQATPQTGPGIPDFENAGVQAKDFILKMIIMTPINILKGLAELIDPHVALSKIIKTGSGFAFNQLELALDPAAEGIAEAQKAIMEETGASAEELDAFAGPSGNDLLKLILCLLDVALQEEIPVPGPPWGPWDAEGVPLEPDPRPDNFYPRIGEKGIDFTGTIMGMFMIPPSPIGLIYLLLGLINNDELDTTQDVIDVTPEVDCDEPVPEGTVNNSPEEE